MSLVQDGAEDWRFSTAERVGLSLLWVAATALVAGLWLHPWRVAEGNADLSGVPTSTASASLVGGCSPTDYRNLISCRQLVDFMGGKQAVRGTVLVTDGYRNDHEQGNSVVVRYDVADPQRFRLVDGNPGPVRRVLGSTWLSVASLGIGGVAVVALVLLAGTTEVVARAVVNRTRGRS